MRSVGLLCILIPCITFAQTGPGGVGTANGASTLRGWWRGDVGITLTGGAVSTWADQSGYANNLTQATAGNRPTTATSAALNNMSIVRYNGSNSQFFNSSFSGPGVDNLTLFVVANGTNYQSLIRFQQNSSPFVVYPWSGGQTFISSSDGGTGSGVASGLVASTNNVGGARYRRNTTNGMQTYLNGAINAQRNSANSVLPSEPFFSGKYNLGTEYPTADVGEMIVYYTALNDAQMVIVQNYLSAKYNVTLGSNDVYTMDNPGNGNYDFDVAGIGRVNSTNFHDDARGTGIVRFLNPTDLEDGEYFMWGHDNGAAQATNTTDVPSGVVGRFARVWRVSETGGDGDVGNLDIQIDVTGLSDFASLSTCDAALSLRLLVDTNNNGNFADQTPIAGATNIGGNVYRFANVNAITNTNRFTFALVSSSVSGPGGVGGTNGTTSLKLWLDSNKGVTTSSGNLVTWLDQSGNGISTTSPAVANRPAFSPNTLNGFPVISFDGSNDNLELSTNINTSTPTMFTVLNKTSVGSGYVTFLTLQNNLWTARNPSNDQWGMYNNTDVLSGVTLNSTYRILTSIERNFNDVDVNTNGVVVNRTNGTGYHGKALGTIGSNNNGSTNTGLQFFNGNIAEVIVYNTNLNLTEQIMVENALAAKYGLSLGAYDVYTMDNPGNGNFDYDVAGIGRISATDLHADAKGPGIVRINGATSLGNNEGLLWGHNNGSLTTSTADVPSGIQGRLTRVWAVNEVGEVGSIDMQFDLSGLGPVTASDLRLLVDHDADGVFNEAGTIIVSGAAGLSCNNFLFNGVSALNDGLRFTLGTINLAQTPLPVELISFSGNLNQRNVELDWKTATELNNDYFSIERSDLGEKFETIGLVKGAGKSTSAKAYSFIDYAPLPGKQYYRLRQTDFDGKYTYSQIITITNTSSESVYITPNPIHAGEELQIRLLNSSEENNYQVSIFDMMGKSIRIENYRKENGSLFINIDSGVVHGIYLIRIESQAGSITRRISIIN